MDPYTLLVVAFAAAFVVSIVDYWADLGIWRAGVAMGASALGMLVIRPQWQFGIVLVLASSFLTMALLSIIERVNYRRSR